MGKVHGYIELDAALVFDACCAYFHDREERQNKKKEAHIKYHMNKRWFPAKTREAAIEMGDNVFGYEWMLGGTYWANVVESIRSQAKTGIKTNKPIFISDDVHDCIAKFLTHPQPQAGK